MRVGRLPIALVVPALLVGLVGLLGTLQYQWLGKVSEAEREQLRRSLEQRGAQFAEDFDAEITRTYIALQVTRQDLAANDWSAFAGRVDRWQAASRFPQMVRGIYLAESAGERRTLRRYERASRGFEPATDSWPQHLQAVRAQLTGGVPPLQPVPSAKAQFVTISVTPLVLDVPALLIPVSGLMPPPFEAEVPGSPLRPSRAAGETAGLRKFWFQWPGSYVLVDIDGEYVRRTMLPALVARHFPEHGSESYRIAIVSGAGAPLFSRGLPAGARIDPARADVVSPFFTLRLDMVRDLLPGADMVTYRSTTVSQGQPPGEGRGQRMAVVVEHRSAEGQTKGATAIGGQLRILRPGWRLVLRHASGSLDAAVTQARQRNMWLSFGILAVLVAGVMLVVVNARRSDQLAARQMLFVATVSHELRTPLAVIRSAAQNLSAGVVSDPGQSRRYGELIEDEGRRLTDMVEQILEYSGIRGEQPLRELRPVDVPTLAGGVRTACEALCNRAGVALEVQAHGEDVPPVLADEAALGRALHNLVMNALKHAPDGKWIGVSFGATTEGGTQQVWIAVSDRGRGIDAADLRHVFEPFYRGRQAEERQVHGNGLGLSLVKRVAEAHGGSVTVKSVTGEGSTFTLRLPAAPAVSAGSMSPVEAGFSRRADLP